MQSYKNIQQYSAILLMFSSWTIYYITVTVNW